MTFDYSKFLAENNLTATSRLRNKFLKEEEEQAPAPEEAAPADTSAQEAKLAQLVKHKDEILAQYKNGSLSIDQYRTKIGNIPQQIKQLTADISAAKNPAPEPAPEPSQEEAPAPEQGEELPTSFDDLK